MSSTLSKPDPKVIVGTDRLLWADKLSNTFDGSRFQFKDVELTVCKGQKLGLVGVNGCGKSTLLRVLGGQEPPDRGSVDYPKGTSIIYVEQEPEFPKGATVMEVVYSSSNPLMQALREYTEATTLLEQDPGSDAAMTRFQRAMANMDSTGGWEVDQYAQTVMTQLHVMKLQGQVADNLSGGERKRVALAAALIQKPDVLILDEPTNHLDVEAIEWLEGLLADRALTFMVVTHDRYFLENVCQEILELDAGSLYRYPGSYERFLQAKEDRIALEDAARQDAKNKLRTELEWMRKQPRARQAKSKAREAAFYELKDRANAPGSTKAGGLALSSQTARLGGTILEMKGGCLAFGQKIILDDFTYEFAKGERVGIVGGNGAGKTTFLNVLTGRQPLDSGTAVTGETVRYGYYQQQGLEMPSGVKVLDLVEEICAGTEEAQQEITAPSVMARRLLTRFEFAAPRWQDFVEKLSGGEKKRLQLLQVLASSPNFLVLDEPTNDLDIQTLGVLEDFLLNDYKGCLIVVSHDRYFMDKVAQHLFVFEGDGIVRDFIGSFSEYLNYRKDMQEEATQAKADKASPASALSEPVYASQTVSSPTRKLTFKERKEYQSLQKEIEALEKKERQLQKKLADAHKTKAGYQDMADWTQEIQDILAQVDEKTARWMELDEIGGT